MLGAEEKAQLAKKNGAKDVILYKDVDMSEGKSSNELSRVDKLMPRM